MKYQKICNMKDSIWFIDKFYPQSCIHLASEMRIEFNTVETYIGKGLY